MKILSVITAIVLAMLVSVSAAAETLEPDYGTERIEAAVPDDAAEILADEGITPDNGGVLSLSFTDVLKSLWELICEKSAKPLKLLASLCGVVLICALADSIADGGSLRGVFSAVGVLAGAGIVISSIYEILSQTLSLLSDAAAFMLVFIPVFSGIAAVLGHVGAASAVNAATLAATQLFSQLAVNFLAPLCGTIMGLSVTGAINPQLNLSKLGELIKRFIVWGLSLIMTVFTSVLSAQTFVANASDSTLLRTAKFVVSSGVPIVGSTISDAVGTVQGGLIMLKSSVGTFGIAAAAAIILPMLVTILCYKLAVVCARALSDVFGNKELSALFESFSSVMSIIIAVVSCFLLLSVIAVVILLAITSGQGE